MPHLLPSLLHHLHNSAKGRLSTKSYLDKEVKYIYLTSLGGISLPGPLGKIIKGIFFIQKLATLVSWDFGGKSTETHVETLTKLRKKEKSNIVKISKYR
jgi:hypothetical protein